MKERRREKGREKGREEEEEEEEEERYGNYFCMEYYAFVWRLFVYGTCMEVFVWMLVVPFLGFS